MLWYISRATGLVALGLLTATLVLGLLTAGRLGTVRLPRFAVGALHRNLSLLTVVFLVVHIASAVLDGYVEIAWLDVVLPFASVYQPFWVGLGAVAVDLMIAVVVTSLLRTRIPARWWRLVHLSAYALWPVALLHGFGMGTADTGLVIAFDVACLAAVAVALTWRVTRLQGAR
ncbi:ferric reductase-like transmembrane domain-containing protein [Actinokineospora sp. NBRC 105648]|uniref:ferric reductase-like transmembrane domain-containing protein n=1 Tax=Actinokineospora sp. NBRC 105648 TaxID=3032206 RepID=UPI0024A4B52C|nr:ferric reductase-like transmembrane domain-containing protein [Actinokineospora sp. NBRC 105648]GLZ39467.1 ferric reductase [Actinokineospora sp. NBRC 105648]